MGEAPEDIVLVQSPADVADLEVRDPSKLAWLSQTTLSVDETLETVGKLRERFPQLMNPPSDDICYATQNRQLAVKQIAAHSDLVIVVGSANSSNSVRLVEVALEAGAKASYRVDNATEIDPAWLEGVSLGRGHQRRFGAGRPGAGRAEPAGRARFPGCARGAVDRGVPGFRSSSGTAPGPAQEARSTTEAVAGPQVRVCRIAVCLVRSGPQSARSWAGKRPGATFVHVRARTRPSGRLRRAVRPVGGPSPVRLLAVLLGAVGLSVVPVAAADVARRPRATRRPRSTAGRRARPAPPSPARASVPTVTADAVDPETGVSVYASDGADGDAGDDAVADWPSARVGASRAVRPGGGRVRGDRTVPAVRVDRLRSQPALSTPIERACVDLASGREDGRTDGGSACPPGRGRAISGCASARSRSRSSARPGPATPARSRTTPSTSSSRLLPVRSCR